MSTKYYQCPDCGDVEIDEPLCINPYCEEGDIKHETKMIPVQVTPETQKPPLGLVVYAPTHSHAKGEECTSRCPVRQWHNHVEKWGNPYPAYPVKPWDEIARTLGYEDRNDMQGALAACASYLRYPIAGVEHQHPNQLAGELDKAVKAMETPKIPFHTVNPEEPYDGDLVWTADGRAWAFYAAKHGWNRAPERDRKPTPEPDDEKIERMARAIHGGPDSWANVRADVKPYYRKQAKAALAALETPATPRLPEGVILTQHSTGLPVVAKSSGFWKQSHREVHISDGKDSVAVTAEYILNKIQEDIENA